VQLALVQASEQLVLVQPEPLALRHEAAAIPGRSK
jgi:hypothetical protein